MHSAGCRKYFNATRHTVSYEILETYKIGEKPTVTEANVGDFRAAFK